MLSYQLENAIKDLDKLIHLSMDDIDDIKAANHNPQFERIALKEEKIKSFEQKKAMIDHEIAKLITSEPNKPLSDLLGDEEHKQLESLKTHLSKLREVNQQYAKMVLSVGAFYNSLLEKIVPTQMQGYQSVASKDASFLQVRV